MTRNLKGLVRESRDAGEVQKLASDLQGIAILSSAATVTLSRLGLCCIRRRYPPGAQILARGEEDDCVLFVLEGEVKAALYSPEGREVAMRRIGPGEVVGDYAALDGQPRSADVFAVTEVQVAQVAAHEFVHMVTADPAVAREQMRELVSMVRQLSRRLYELTTLNAGCRLVSALLQMAQSQGGEGRDIEVLPTHGDLAALISSQRPVVTSELSRLVKDGLIQRRGKGLHLVDLQALRELQGEV